MNGIQQLMRRVDAWQQSHRPVAFVYGVVKKCGDDNAGSLAALIAYYGFLSLFPLLLVAITVLGYVLGGDPGLRQHLINSALGNFPIIGNQLKSSVSHPLSGHPVGLLFGLLGLIWGSMGVTQAAQYAMDEVWHIPSADRPNFVSRLLRGLAFLGILGLSAVVTTALSSLGSFGNIPGAAAVGGPLLAAVANVGLYLLAFRVLTPASVSTRDLLPGAVIGGIGWEILQLAGGYLVGHQLKHSSQVYGMFGVVLGLIGWIYLGAQLAIYAAEVNVVRSRRLWPRTIVQPPLTEADRQVYAGRAEARQQRPEETVNVDFDERAGLDLRDGAPERRQGQRAPTR
ncbi:MAG TPA: YihY/virulence factor BrkB family protein [Acidimicrobiales bacterium]|nr:YihY/virulence factor BrkB family protein [Acidimicrobiales bacterium]